MLLVEHLHFFHVSLRYVQLKWKYVQPNLKYVQINLMYVQSIGQNISNLIKIMSKLI